MIGMDVRGHWLARCWRRGLKADDTQVLDTFSNKKSGVEGDWAGGLRTTLAWAASLNIQEVKKEGKHWICSLCLTPLLPSPQCVTKPQAMMSGMGLHFLLLGLIPQWLCDPMTAKERHRGSLLGLLGKLLLLSLEVMLDGHKRLNVMLQALQPEVVRSEMGGTGDLEDTMQPWASPPECAHMNHLLNIMQIL